MSPNWTREEVEAMLAAIDRRTWCGRRDYALLLTLYNSGARVSEISSLRQDQVIMGRKTYVQLHGRGRKDRMVPVSGVAGLGCWLASLGIASTRMATPIFVGSRKATIRFANPHVAQIGRQVRKKALNVLTLAIPGHKPPDRERMPEVMKTRLIVKPVRAFHIGFIADAFERQFCGQMCDRASIVRG
jgi:hypothetical protein